ncbi:hypothetical protein T492DRAFT_479375 [Pavlovales sp. CCMP2436]|nr:hypothetical protein T492DRAFT_479375 [Pavlovales sp. CCMP2436]
MRAKLSFVLMSAIGEATTSAVARAVADTTTSSVARAVAGTVPWHERLDRSIGKSKKDRGANFVQIATVDRLGAPHCRTVVMRGFEAAAGEGGDVLRMVTDTRSDKICELIARPECELVWWFGKSSEQYRISGRMELVADDPMLLRSFTAEALAAAAPAPEQREALMAARKQQWGNLSDQSREQWFMPTPGKPVGEEPVGNVPAGGRDVESGKVVEPPESFALLLLRPRRVDYLCLSGNLRQIDLRSPECDWTGVIVVG